MWSKASVYGLLILLLSYERKLDRLSTQEREKNASCMIALFAIKCCNLRWRLSPINLS